MIEIRTGDRQAAFSVPFQVYDSDSPYVSPMWSDFDRRLDPQRNPFCKEGRGSLQLFTAHRDGHAVGRIAATVHHASNERHNTRRGQFGFFDCEDNPEVANALLISAEGWVAEQGAQEMVGNFNLAAMQMVGVVTDGFQNVPYTDMMWSPPHIAEQLASCGYTPMFPMSTFETDLEQVARGSLLGPRQLAILADPDYTWHPITRCTFRVRNEEARQLVNDGFSNNPMFVPISAEEYEFQAGEMMWIMDPRLWIMVHHKGRPAGVIVCIPDLNPFVSASKSKLSLASVYHYIRHRLTRDRAVIVFYSVSQRLQGQGLNGAMLHRLIEQAQTAGYKRLGTTWIADVNLASLRQMERIGAERLHRLHLFRKPLVAGIAGDTT